MLAKPPGRIWTHLRIGQRFQPKPTIGYTCRTFPSLGHAMEYARCSKQYHLSHVSQSTKIPSHILKRIESGEVKPTSEQIHLIERILGVPITAHHHHPRRRI